MFKSFKLSVERIISQTTVIVKIKWPISPLLEVGFKKFFDSHL